MKNTLTSTLLLAFLLMAIAPKAQGLLGIGTSGISGLPDSTAFGDTIRNMQLFVVNRGTNTVAGTIVQLQAAPNFMVNPFLIGTLDLSLLTLNPGDSIAVPLDYFVVSPQNSNSGSNIMVIWPTAPGTTPKDSAEQGYYVDDVTARPGQVEPATQWILFPNPSDGKFQFMMKGNFVPDPELVLYNANGLEQYRCKLYDMQMIDVSGLPHGCYYYHIVSKNVVVDRRKLVICR